VRPEARCGISTRSFVEAFVGYRLINCEKGVLSLFAGARYNYMSGDLQIFDDGDPRFPILRQRLGIPDNLRVSGSKEWVDPVIGTGGKVKLAKPVSFYAKGDIGGFGAASDFTWQVGGWLGISNHPVALFGRGLALPEIRLHVRRLHE
jgi:hypothetical protein